MASLKLSFSITYEFEITRGSAVIKPSTSVQISKIEALRAAASMAAV